jgi:hypothetical protein
MIILPYILTGILIITIIPLAIWMKRNEKDSK